MKLYNTIYLIRRDRLSSSETDKLFFLFLIL